MSSAGSAGGTSASTTQQQGQQSSTSAQNTPTTPQSPAGATGGIQQPQAGVGEGSALITNPEAQRFAQEAAQYRTQLRDVQAQLATAQKQHHLQWAALDVGETLGLTTRKAVAAALKLADLSALEYADDGVTPKNLDAVLKRTVEEYPFLTSSAVAAGQQPGAGNGGAFQFRTAGGPTNPGRSSVSPTGGHIYTPAELADFDFYEKNKQDIYAAMREGRIQGG